MPLFLDACALAKRYIPEGQSTRRMQEITGRFDRWGGFVVSSLIHPEIISAFAKYARAQAPHEEHFFRRHPAIVDALRRDLSKATFTIMPVTDDEIDAAADLLKANPHFNIGAGDAIHLVTAITARRLGAPMVFVTADAGLEAAAQAHGFDVFNPIRHPVAKLEEMPGLAA